MASYIIERSDEHLAHHGIKGQKWGVRRYQNDDGTLTPEGKKRYNGRYDADGGLTDKGYRNLESVSNRYNKAYKEYEHEFLFGNVHLSKKDISTGKKLSDKLETAIKADGHDISDFGNLNGKDGVAKIKELSKKYLEENEANRFASVLDKAYERDQQRKSKIERLKERKDSIGEKYTKAQKEFVDHMVKANPELKTALDQRKKQDEIDDAEWKRISNQEYLNKIGRDKSNPKSKHLREYKGNYEFDGDGSEFWWEFADSKIIEASDKCDENVNRALRKAVEKMYSNTMNKNLSEIKSYPYNAFGDDSLSDLFGIGNTVIIGRYYGDI